MQFFRRSPAAGPGTGTPSSSLSPRCRGDNGARSSTDPSSSSRGGGCEGDGASIAMAAPPPSLSVPAPSDANYHCYYYFSLGDDDEEEDEGYKGDYSQRLRSRMQPRSLPYPLVFRRRGGGGVTTGRPATTSPPPPASTSSTSSWSGTVFAGGRGNSWDGTDPPVRLSPTKKGWWRRHASSSSSLTPCAAPVKNDVEHLQQHHLRLLSYCDADNTCTSSFHPNNSKNASFSTAEETDDDDNNDNDEGNRDGGGTQEVDLLLLDKGTTTTTATGHVSIQAAQERWVRTAVRWHDQQLGGSVVTNVHLFPYVRPAYLRVVLLLVHPVIRRFEFLHCELPEQRLTVWDLLQQLPGLATEPSLRHVRYHALCRHRRSCRRSSRTDSTSPRKRKTSQTKKLIDLLGQNESNARASSSSSFDDDDDDDDEPVPKDGEDKSLPSSPFLLEYNQTAGADNDKIISSSSNNDPKPIELIHRLDIHCYELFEGEILLAVPSGVHPRSIVRHADAMLENRVLMRMLHRAKLSGRALRRLRPSKTYGSEEIGGLRRGSSSQNIGVPRSPLRASGSSPHHASPPMLPLPPPPPPPLPPSPQPLSTPSSPKRNMPFRSSTPPASLRRSKAETTSPEKSSSSSSSRDRETRSPRCGGPEMIATRYLSTRASPPSSWGRRGEPEKVVGSSSGDGESSSPRSVVLGILSTSSSIFQPRLILEGGSREEGEAEGELDDAASVPLERVLLIQQRERLAQDEWVANREEEADDDDDMGIITDNELFFGSIREPELLAHRSCHAAVPLSCPTFPIAPASPRDDGEPFVAFRKSCGASPVEKQAVDRPSVPHAATWDRWIAHYMSCPGAGD